MNIVQITPGAGGMFCGNCFRDNALVGALRRLGHDILMVPLYLPIRLDEEDQTAGTPIFFGGINVYLDQQASFFRKTPPWFHRLMNHPRLLRWASGRAAKTRASEVGALTVSMLRGEAGHQARELDELVGWLRANHGADVICLSNALLLGLARQLKETLGAKIVCCLQGEDTFLDALLSPHREQAWELLRERAADVDLFVAPSRYFRDLMAERMGLPEYKTTVVANGISLDGYHPADAPVDPPVLGYFARMCREKGLDTLVEAYLLLKRDLPNLRLHVGGGLGPADRPWVDSLWDQLKPHAADVKLFPNVDRAEKVRFYRSLTAFSVPARYGEAYGLYVIEALAAGVPVVQPRTAAFPELLEATGGGALCAPEDPRSLADALAPLLKDPAHARAVGALGRGRVLAKFGIERMAQRILECYQKLVSPAQRQDALNSESLNR